MLYAISNNVPITTFSKTSLEEELNITTMNTQSPLGYKIMAKKRNYIVIEVDANLLYSDKTNYSATLITPDNKRHRIKIKNKLHFASIFTYKPKSPYLKFVDKMVKILSKV